jgi:hypothetical protein
MQDDGFRPRCNTSIDSVSCPLRHETLASRDLTISTRNLRGISLDDISGSHQSMPRRNLFNILSKFSDPFDADFGHTTRDYLWTDNVQPEFHHLPTLLPAQIRERPCLGSVWVLDRARCLAARPGRRPSCCSALAARCANDHAPRTRSIGRQLARLDRLDAWAVWGRLPRWLRNRLDRLYVRVIRRSLTGKCTRAESARRHHNANFSFPHCTFSLLFLPMDTRASSKSSDCSS